VALSRSRIVNRAPGWTASPRGFDDPGELVDLPVFALRAGLDHAVPGHAEDLQERCLLGDQAALASSCASTAGVLAAGAFEQMEAG
jgi:hypothetical protein